ncbi:hypothetical protein [Lysinibacillus sp. Ag94]|uniref:hypothetical protein n=1 Tax=unclassified Lysinibacillus TaxID=2636778 RepID=UPI00200D0640|nr:hypothetical protein [Lysinibacillus sp. Ag94]UPW82030.1 hypothetical protein MY533_14900 [Lysinibacillus sp. Ag94]
MHIKKQLLGTALGYVLALFIAYIFFDYFSWSFTVGSIVGICLFALILMFMKRR